MNIAPAHLPAAQVKSPPREEGRSWLHGSALVSMLTLKEPSNLAEPEQAPVSVSLPKDRLQDLQDLQDLPGLPCGPYFSSRTLGRSGVLSLRGQSLQSNGPLL